MPWPNDKTLKFVEALELEQALWNPKHDGHKDRNIVHDSWCTLQRKFGITVKKLQIKKKMLFILYRKYALKVADSMKSGSGTDYTYRPTWYLYEALNRFLHSIYFPVRTINSLETENEMESRECDEGETTEPDMESRECAEGETTEPDMESRECDEGETTEPDIGQTTVKAEHSDQPTVTPFAKRFYPMTSPVVIKQTKTTKRKLSASEEVTNPMGEAVETLKTVAAQPGKSNSPPKKECLELLPPTAKAEHSDQPTVTPVAKSFYPMTSPVLIEKNITKKIKLSASEEVTNRMDISNTVALEPGKSNFPPKKDRLELFTDMLLEKLRTLDDEATQELVMHEIDNLIFRVKNPNNRRILDSGLFQGHQPPTSSILYSATPYYQQPPIFPIHTPATSTVLLCTTSEQLSQYFQSSQPSPISQSSASSQSQPVTSAPS